ncbi:MAG: hypothetical protein HOV81_22510 [Kofleriaceae bacterium]|nr:hypothetical protein [Kofleriaceae bacterium]
MRSLISLAFVLPAFAACSPYNPELGPVPFLCGQEEPRCPDGYTCEDGSNGAYCLAPNGVIPPDAVEFECHDDQNLEPNNDCSMAFQVPVKPSITFAGLAICPKNDKDTYAVTVTANQNLEAIIEFEDGGAAISGSIMNNTTACTPIMNASPVTGMPRVVRAYTPNLPAGTYYVQAYGPPTGALQVNNYKLTINVTGP